MHPHPRIHRYAGADNTEDDVAIIRAKLGFRPDDFGDTLETAAALSLPTNFNGTVGLGGDVDVFKFQVPGSARVAITLSLVDPFVRDGAAMGWGRSNLNAELTLLDSSGAVLRGWSSDGGLLAGTFTSESVATAGAYYLRIRGVGQGQSATVGEGLNTCYVSETSNGIATWWLTWGGAVFCSLKEHQSQETPSVCTQHTHTHYRNHEHSIPVERMQATAHMEARAFTFCP